MDDECVGGLGRQIGDEAYGSRLGDGGGVEYRVGGEGFDAGDGLGAGEMNDQCVGGLGRKVGDEADGGRLGDGGGVEYRIGGESLDSSHGLGAAEQVHVGRE